MLRLAPLLQQLLPLRWSRTPLLPSGDVGNIAAEGQGEARATKGAEINSLRGGQSRDFLACLPWCRPGDTNGGGVRWRSSR